MRKNILTAGVALFVLALLFGESYTIGLFFSVPISILNIVLGLVTRTPPGLNLEPESSQIRLVIDRAVSRGSIYQLVFTNSKLIFKRLSSVMVTVVLAFVLAIAGFAALFIVGALMGGVTGFSLQEFLTQRTRNKIGNGALLTTKTQRDIQIEYNELTEVKLVRNRLYLFRKEAVNTASFPSRYSKRVRPLLSSIFTSKFSDNEKSLGAAETSKKENEKGEHPSGDRR